MKYYSRIKIDRHPQYKSFTKEIDLGHETMFNLDDLRRFGVDEQDQFSFDGNTLYIYKTRLETEAELAQRIAKEEDYNKRFDEYHKNKKQ